MQQEIRRDACSDGRDDLRRLSADNRTDGCSSRLSGRAMMRQWSPRRLGHMPGLAVESRSPCSVSGGAGAGWDGEGFTFPDPTRAGLCRALVT